MEHDQHYSRTANIAATILRADEAQLLAWSNWMVDCTTLTTCNAATWLLPGAGRRMKAFHFIPGTNGFWCDIPDYNMRLRDLIGRAGDWIELGIALHALQDSYSHQDFVGGFSKHNSGFAYASWWRSVSPNFCHNDFVKLPDMYDAVWYDPRTELIVDNEKRFDAAAAYVRAVMKAPPRQTRVFPTVRYDDRKRKWEEEAGVQPFEDIHKDYWSKYGRKWQKAAVRQRTFILNSF